MIASRSGIDTEAPPVGRAPAPCPRRRRWLPRGHWWLSPRECPDTRRPWKAA